MLILIPSIFNDFPNVTFGFSTKIGLNRKEPFYFNLSQSVGDDYKIVEENRKAFLNELGLNLESVVLQKQIHSDIITMVDDGNNVNESDALITNKTGIGLAIFSADCNPIFIYDPSHNVIAAIHAGWRGTEKNITAKVLRIIQEKYNSSLNDLYVYIGPGISQINYEVQSDVAERFDDKYILNKEGKIYLDVLSNNYDELISAGIPENQIQKSNLCSFENKNLLHSYRRDGKISGRALGVIAMKGK